MSKLEKNVALHVPFACYKNTVDKFYARRILQSRMSITWKSPVRRDYLLIFEIDLALFNIELIVTFKSLLLLKKNVKQKKKN